MQIFTGYKAQVSDISVSVSWRKGFSTMLLYSYFQVQWFRIQCMLDCFYSFCIQAKYTNKWCVLTMHDGLYRWKKQNKISNQKSWGYTQEPELTTPTNTSWCDYGWQSKTKSKTTICALIFNTTLSLFIASKFHFICLRKTIEWLSFFSIFAWHTRKPVTQRKEDWKRPLRGTRASNSTDVLFIYLLYILLLAGSEDRAKVIIN